MMNDFQRELLERLTRIETQLTERCAHSLGRIGALETSSLRQGERLGKLEALEQQRKGGLAAIAALAGAAGAGAAKLWPFGGQ